MSFATVPRRRLYPVLGLFLAIGAPGGLLLMRSLAHAELGAEPGNLGLRLAPILQQDAENLAVSIVKANSFHS